MLKIIATNESNSHPAHLSEPAAESERFVLVSVFAWIRSARSEANLIERVRSRRRDSCEQKSKKAKGMRASERAVARLARRLKLAPM